MLAMKLFRLGVAVLLSVASLPIFAASFQIVESADKIRFEQYVDGTLALYRLPTPGASQFPGGTCTRLVVPGATEITNRFIAFYLFAKSNNKTYFVYYETTKCEIISFGIDG